MLAWWGWLLACVLAALVVVFLVFLCWALRRYFLASVWHQRNRDNTIKTRGPIGLPVIGGDLLSCAGGGTMDEEAGTANKEGPTPNPGLVVMVTPPPEATTVVTPPTPTELRVPAVQEGETSFSSSYTSSLGDEDTDAPKKVVVATTLEEKRSKLKALRGGSPSPQAMRVFSLGKDDSLTLGGDVAEAMYRSSATRILSRSSNNLLIGILRVDAPE